MLIAAFRTIRFNNYICHSESQCLNWRKPRRRDDVRHDSIPLITFKTAERLGMRNQGKYRHYIGKILPVQLLNALKLFDLGMSPCAFLAEQIWDNND